MVRVNIANSYERLSRPLEALVHFERFLVEATSASPQQRREVETAIRRLRQLVGAIEVHVVPDGAGAGVGFGVGFGVGVGVGVGVGFGVGVGVGEPLKPFHDGGDGMLP